MAVVRKGGKIALTRFKVMKSFGGQASLVECRLATGRTHQIRVHMASLGHPVVGDPLYGGGKSFQRGLRETAAAAIKALDHQILHAYILGFNVENRAEAFRFESELPSYFKGIIEKIEGG